MTFAEVCGRTRAGTLSREEPAEILGISERSFQCWRGWFEAEGFHDRWLGKVSAGRAAVDEVMMVLGLFDTRCRDFGVKHLHEARVAGHGFRRSYACLRIILEAHGRVQPIPPGPMRNRRRHTTLGG